MGGLFFGGYVLVNLPIENIVIRNTTYLNDDYILELAKIKNYPSYIMTTKSSPLNTLAKTRRYRKSPYNITKNAARRSFFA